MSQTDYNSNQNLLGTYAIFGDASYNNTNMYSMMGPQQGVSAGINMFGGGHFAQPAHFNPAYNQQMPFMGMSQQSSF